MTKKLYLTLLGLISLPLFSQSYNRYDYSFYSKSYHVERTYVYKDDGVDSFALSRQIKKIELVTTTYNDKHSRGFVSVNKDVFDRNGRLIEQVNMEDTGKKQWIRRINTRSFNEYGKVASSNHFYYGRNQFRMFEYNDSHQLVRQVNYNRKGIYSIVENTYGIGNLYNTTLYRDKKGRVTSMYRYFYYPNKQMKQIVWIGKKGKVKRVWDYTCDETGKSLKNLKDTSKICSIKSYLPDGVVVTTTQSFNSFGEPWKTIHHIDSNGRTIKYQHYEGKEEKLVYEFQNKYNGRRLESRSDYSFYNKKTYRKDIVYDTSGRIVSELSTHYRKESKKKTYKTTYVYNEQGLITEKNIFVDGLLKTREKFTYEFYAKN
jgi:hypothetical protein